MENVRNNMAKLIQRSLNAIWESRIIAHIEESEEIDTEYLDSLIEAYIKTEDAFSDILFNYKLKIEGKFQLKKYKFKGIPRRMRVVFLEDHEQPTRMGYLTKAMKEFYQDKCDGISFYLVYNMFSNKIPLTFKKDWQIEGSKRMNLEPVKYYTRNDISYVLMKNNWDTTIEETSYFELQLDGNLEYMFEEEE